MHAEPFRSPHVPLSSTEKVGWIAAICREALSAENLSQALDRAVKLAPKLGEFADEAAWVAERDVIRAAVLDRGWSEQRQAYAHRLHGRVVEVQVAEEGQPGPEYDMENQGDEDHPVERIARPGQF